MMTKKLSYTTFMLALASSSFSYADTTFELGRIEVNAEKPLPALGSSTVDAETLRDENRENVTEALDRIPGITVTNIGARSEQIVQLRGFDLRQVPVFVDGIPIYVPYDGYVDLGRFTTFDLAGIDVSKSFSSVLYGPNVMGGAINLVSRKPTEKLEGEIGAGYNVGDRSGSEGKRTWLNLGSNQGLWYAQFGASYRQQDSFSLSDDFDPVASQNNGLRNNADRKDTKINIKLGLTPNATDEYAIGYVKQDGEKNTPPYAGDNPDVRTRYWQWPYWDKESVYLLTNTALSDDSYIKTRFYYDSFDNLLSSFDDDTYSSQTRGYAFDSFYDDETYGASVEYGKTLGRHDVKLAAHYKFDEHKENDLDEPVRTFQDITTSLAIEDTIRLTDKQYLVAGISYDKRRSEQADDIDTGQPFDTNDADSWNPQIGYFVELDDSNEARLTLSKKTRFPTIKDRYSYRFGSALPNPGLDAEQSKTIEAGWVHRVGTTARFDVAFFYSDIKDLIQEVSITPNIFQFQNVGEVSARGIELGSDFWLGKWEFGGNYTYLDRVNKSSDLKLTDVPSHKLFTYATWHISQPLSISATAQYESKRYTTTEGDRIADAFTIAGVRAKYQFDKGVTARLGVENLFDKNYEYQEGFPEAGRTYYANLSYQF
ncbi:TonB-dependent receptor plug domain-containing protein [Methylophaga sp. OBS3]|uniref:TonB-dependent receptor plug domain-containing protein n=1 Tax=Methylophaga sp. OBS3 TaxID=2991934 RepID=UPI00225C27D5|nr:TonB-dependent receptor [Methylophaga sp. OBS3]MCX4190581.1 TonB-dependent receptor [Methylophaga sp. OBS3]